MTLTMTVGKLPAAAAGTHTEREYERVAYLLKCLRNHLLACNDLFRNLRRENLMHQREM